jgi:hypothetical protein
MRRSVDRSEVESFLRRALDDGDGDGLDDGDGDESRDQ